MLPEGGGVGKPKLKYMKKNVLGSKTNKKNMNQ